MNDLMTKSFLSYVELKKQAQKDLEADLDVETGAGKLNPSSQENLSQFFQEVGAIKADMEEITNLLHDLHCLNEEAKSTHSANILRGLRDRMESDTVAVLRKAKIIKARLEVLDQSNAINRKMSNVYKEGSTADRTRMSITGGLRVKLRDLMDNFQYLREKIVSDHKEDLKRRYYSATGDLPSDEMIEKIISGSLKVELFEGKTELDMGNKVRHEAVIDIQGSLTKLHQVFLDMAVLVEAQGEDIENIEENVANAGYCISGGTNSLHYASQMKKKKKWVYWVWAVGLIILMVCIISMFAS
ncbi:syntaxin-112-like [Malus sylvestris]|uniref:syntaxin-112-like n=1 Tax=Malus sylvestris TaxID=3752 RepID=UPI0021AC588A|nr:syntaxin-112-like [Malus sylvestris]XP_050128061.1 syntaxin-112-like [Malus sylvestris]XP_050128062.1 syntaxin-112-like [Malus sylvestris]XP_050128063.1 syntaxin-112-like [Malus sylvestris]